MRAGIISNVVKTLVIADLLFTTVVFIYPFNQALTIAALGEEPKMTCTSRASYIWMGNFIRAASIVGVALVAVYVPNFTILSGLTGGFGNNILALILPPMFYYSLKRKSAVGDHKSRGEDAALVLTFLFGVGFLVLTLIFFAKQVRGSG